MPDRDRPPHARPTVAERLERRQLCAAGPLVLTGGAAANTFYLRENADGLHLDVWQNATAPGVGVPTQSPLVASVTTVTVNAKGAGDTVTLDFANGDPFPSAVSVVAGTGSANTLVVRGATVVAVGGATVTVGPTPIAFSAVQRVEVDGTAGDDTLTQTAQPPVPVVFNGGGGDDTLDVDAGTFTLAATAANLTANVAGELYLTAGAAGTGLTARPLAAVNVAAGGAVTVDTPVSAADRAVMVVGSLSVAAGGTFDLSGNDLVVRNAAAASVRAVVTSTFADAYAADAATLAVLAAPSATFDGQTVTPADVVVRSTTDGDATLDGTVDGQDYGRVDVGFAAHLTGWTNGDFNGDGVVDAADYTAIDNAFNLGTAATPPPLDYALHNALNVADEQARRTLAAPSTTTASYPRTVNTDGTWADVSPSDWTAGTWPGQLWELYKATGNPFYKTAATAFTTPLAADDHNTGDVGFEVYDSFYPLLQADPANAAAYTSVLLTAAASKAAQYNATVGSFKAWRNSTSGNPAADFDVLDDYLMDSQLLFWAAAQTGNQTYYDEAVANATVEENYIVHADGSTSQFAYFNAATGAFVDNETYQGYSNTSVWSRGQAWAIYGFAQCYAATGRGDFLVTSERAADWYVAHLPADRVPYWDFDAPTIPNAPRDTSAAAVAASGLLRLAAVLAPTDPAKAAGYRADAGAILASLCTPAYLNSPTAADDGVLLHGALNVPANNGTSDTPINFGDYYFAEAINEYLAAG